MDLGGWRHVFLWWVIGTAAYSVLMNTLNSILLRALVSLIIDLVGLLVAVAVGMVRHEAASWTKAFKQGAADSSRREPC
ncbi:hypothetical protein ACIBG0_40545 [Nocardia sp. NPDC050630]|uniref:hypothetical protein n=1 Tax=Nocardia sp. NPDC050630 TaxID=3364321 RepID=UPI0037AF2716